MLASTFVRRSDMYVFVAETDFGKAWQAPIPVGLGTRVPLGASTAWSFLGSAPKKMIRFDHNLFFYFRPLDQPAKASELRLAWDQLPWPLMIRGRIEEDPKRELDDVLSRNKIPRPFWKNWPLLVSLEDPSKIVAVIGVEVLKKYKLEGVGRCVSMESLYSDSLRSDS